MDQCDIYDEPSQHRCEKCAWEAAEFSVKLLDVACLPVLVSMQRENEMAMNILKKKNSIPKKSDSLMCARGIYRWQDKGSALHY